MPLIDTHAHVDQLEDINGALTRAKEAGVAAIVGMSVDLASMRKVLEIAESSLVPKVYAALGVHPGNIKPEDQEANFDFIKANIHRAIAVGETGLDYWYKWVRKDEVERKKQKDSFERHLNIACAFNLPIVIHSRGAWRDCLSMTKAAGVKQALFHWYSGPVDILEQILSAGYYVSTSISVGYSPESRAAMAEAPIERILVETDSPVRYKDSDGDFLAEPKDVARTVKALASLKNLDEDIVLSQVNQNAQDFFKIKI
jgi:TatD DNase family protein